MSVLQVAEQFVAAINAHDVERIAALMSPDHRFTDSLGNEVERRESMRGGWDAYFEMAPDYTLVIAERFLHTDNKEQVILLGMARGSYATEGHLRAGSAWSTAQRYGRQFETGTFPSGKFMRTTNPSGS
ncbi:MAG: hypothetical protein QOJ64_2546 [Acidobacteriota bacterium]|jgi:ketosteroid isomerase-like protein|nr:hypothetical protein [Acidobacteriota bacterium]